MQKTQLKRVNKKVVLLTAMSVLLTAILVLSGVGIYFKLTHKEKHAEVNPLDFSYDTWDGTIEAVDFNEEYAGRGVLTKTINSAAAFAHFISEVNNGNDFANYIVYLNANIDLNGRTISSIGNSANPFKGTFDGGHYTILNAKIKGNGLFESTENATIKNVGLYKCKMLGGSSTSAQNDSYALINRAINTNVENCFVRLGNANLINEYISNNGEHYIKNSFVDSEANGLVGSIDTNNSSENKVTISNSYFTKGEAAVLSEVGTADVEEKDVIKATNKSDFADWNYSAEYKTDKEWCDYNYLANSQKLDFVYPLQAGFVKVYLTGSCYESVVTSKNGNVSVDTTNLAEAFTEADKQEEAQVNLLVEKIFMEAKAEVANTNVTINAVKNTTIVRGENNTDAMFVGNGTSKIILGSAPNVGTASVSNATPAILTLDGNRKYFEKNNLDSGALVVANGGEVEIHENVVIKNNVNNTTGYGGAVIVANAQEEVKIGATFENCSSTAGGGAVTIITEQETLTLSKSAEYINCSSASGGALYIANTLPEETVEEMRKLYGRNINIKPTEDYVERQTTLTELTGTNTFKGCSATYDGTTNSTGYGGAIYCTTDFSISGTATFGGSAEGEGNSAIGGSYGRGGAIYCSKTLTINEGAEATFIGNSATGTSSGQGGAIYVNGNIIISGSATFGGENEGEGNTANSSGGAIYISSGSYSLTITETAEVDFIGNSATSYGGAIYGKTTIDGIATFTGNTSSSSSGAISGTTTINGTATFTGNTAAFYGGAISGSTTINGTATFTGNTASTSAGAINGTTIIDGSATFTGNTAASYGGAIYGETKINENAEVVLKGNAAKDGGALYSDNKSVTIAGKATFGGENDGDGNIASGTSYGGGAISCGSSVIITDTANVEFINNSSTYRGGAIWCYTIKISGKAKFEGNKTTGPGGAIYTMIQNSTLTPITTETAEVEFIGNSSSGSGGAIYNRYAANWAGSVTFQENSASGSGGAIYSYIYGLELSGNITFINNSSLTTGSSSSGGGAINSRDVRITGNATFTGNSSTGPGGAINADFGYVTISGKATFGGIEEVEGNTAAKHGGAIYIHDSTKLLTVTETAEVDFIGNSASSYGGAIYGSTTINGTATFTENSASSGGAIYGTTTIDGTGQFENNTSTSYDGGAIEGTTTINEGAEATFTSNTGRNGGAIYSSKVEISGKAVFEGNYSYAIYMSSSSSGTYCKLLGDITFKNNYNPEKAVSSQYEIYLLSETNIIGSGVKFISDVEVRNIYLYSSRHIQVVDQLATPVTVYKYSAAAYNNDNTASYIFEDITEEGLKNVGGIYPFKVVNAPAGTAVDFNNLKPKFGVLAAGTTVTLDLDGGESAENSVVVFENTPYGSLPTPTKEGYEFLGWFTSGGTKVNSTTKVFTSGEHTLYAKYASTSYTTTYGNNVSIPYVSSSAGTYTTTSSNPSVATVMYSPKVLGGVIYDAVVEPRGFGTTTITMSFVPNDPSVESFEKTYEVTVSMPDKLDTPTLVSGSSGDAWLGWTSGELTSSIASWNSVLGAVSYSIQLYKDGVASGSAKSTTETTLDLTSTLISTGVGTYTFTVTAIAENAENNSEVSALSSSRSVRNLVIVKEDGISSALINEKETMLILQGGNGVEFNLTATIAENYLFDGWSSSDALSISFGDKSLSTTTLQFINITNSSTEEITITANAKYNGFKVSFTVNDSSFGEVSRPYVMVPSGSTLTAEGSVVRVNGVEISAIPASSNDQYSYSFVNWTGVASQVDRDLLIMANFTSTVNSYTVKFSVDDSSNGYGSINIPQVKVAYGTFIVFKDNTAQVGTNKIIATPTANSAQYAYRFVRWKGAIEVVEGATEILAEFAVETRKYTITFEANDPTLGEIKFGDEIATSIIVEYGEPITHNDNVVTINGADYTAITKPASTGTENRFAGWEGLAEEVVSDMTITAVFESQPTLINVTIKVVGDTYGTVSQTTLSVPYGSKIFESGSVLTVGSEYVYAMPKDADMENVYVFDGWTYASSEVTEEMEITATFKQAVRTYTVTIHIDDTSGTISDGTTTEKTINVEVHYLAKIVVKENSITIIDGETTTVITATANEGYTFEKWIGVVGTVEGSITITASCIAN